MRPIGKAMNGMARLFHLACAMVLATAGSAVQAGSIPDFFGADRASDKISVAVTPGVRRMSDLPDLFLRNARQRMQAGEAIPDAALRQLAILNEGLAAQRYARRLLARSGANPSDIAFYSAIAVGTGRVATLPDMIAAMRRLDPATESRARMRKYVQVLYAHAWAGNRMALNAVIEFNGRGRLFGALSDATRDRILAQAAKAGDGRVELQMAVQLLETRPLTETETRWAQEYLARAGQSGHPGIAAAALSLARQLDRTADPGG